MVPTRVVFVVVLLLSLPTAASARPERGPIITECPTLLQTAAALRLATPAQSAAYRARLTEPCRKHLLAEAEVIVQSRGRFAIWEGHLYLQAGWTGDEFGHSRDNSAPGTGHEGGLSARDIERIVEALKDLNASLARDAAVAAGLAAGAAFGPGRMGATVGGALTAGLLGAKGIANAFGKAIGSAIDGLGGGGNSGGGSNGGDIAHEGRENNR